MNKTEIVNKMTRSFHKVGFTFKKHSPEILVVTGIVGTVVSTVMACKATTKAGAIAEEMKSEMAQIHDVAEMGREDYTEQDLKRDTTIVYAHAALKYAKLYAPSVILGALSISSIFTGHNITRKRNIALAAAYTAIDKGFKEYRGRVVERFGEQLDKELRYNIKSQEVEEIVTDEKGKEKVVKNTVDMMNPNVKSDYSRFFDESCNAFTKNAEYNLTFLKQQEAFANQILQTKGYLFLNDVYYALGIPKTEAGQVVGWIYDEKCPNGDNFVDFGIYDEQSQAGRRFVNGYEPRVLLDFNVDGPILNKVKNW